MLDAAAEGPSPPAEGPSPWDALCGAVLATEMPTYPEP
jgi:hypothetical protein